MGAADWRSRVHQELRRHRPALVVVDMADGGEQKTFKPSGRDRGMWTRLLETLPAEWARIELHDKEGNCLWGLDAPSGTGTVAPVQFGKGTAVDHVTALMKLMLQAQDVALARQGETMSKLQQSYETLISTITGRLTSLENLVSTVLQTAYDATLVSAEAHALLGAGGAEPGSKSADLLAQFLGIKMGVRKGGGRPPNGARPRPTQPEQPSEE